MSEGLEAVARAVVVTVMVGFAVWVFSPPPLVTFGAASAVVIAWVVLWILSRTDWGRA